MFSPSFSRFERRNLGQKAVLMPEAQPNSEVSILRRAIDLWPYVFIVVSVTGLAYIAFGAAR
jgi:hypothetical protein